ncbi:MAG: zinc-ribbon domain-containing protein [Elusimicrobia bacterium]|nr:zinc-ribbon domain-containing protein [Elusimicrobiota bacterium]
MRCPKCNADNKDDVKFCKKCGTPLVVKQTWKPTWKWHLKVLGIIYVVIIALFFLINWLLRDYIRELPTDITPWLKQDRDKAGGERATVGGTVPDIHQRVK